MIKRIRQLWDNLFINRDVIQLSDLNGKIAQPDEEKGDQCTPLELNELYITYTKLTSLQDNLPQSLKKLYCYNNQLISLPNNLPQCLENLSCFDNQLTSLPEKLPYSLKVLQCWSNQLTSLPKELPRGLKYIYCEHNKLISLPDKLPPNLKGLYCNLNRLTILPDLPLSLDTLRLYGNPLEINYPNIFTFKLSPYNYKNYQEVIAYVNECNSQRRTQTRARAIARELAEVYCRQALHPSRLAYLLDNPEEDPNDFMDKLSSNI